MSAGIFTSDRNQLARFARTIFMHAEIGSYVSLRVFDQHDRGKPPLAIEGLKVTGDMQALVDVACKLATFAASTPSAAVFCPPVCTFSSPRRARAQDLANGVAISVDLDKGAPKLALRRLVYLIGAPTIVVASGGELVGEQGETYPKLHAHWRLSEPTCTPDEHERLRQARYYAATLVGGDTTAAALPHPLRWPGSWNRKSMPKLAHIIYQRECEVHLEEALEALREAAAAAGAIDSISVFTGKEHRRDLDLFRLVSSGDELHGPLTALSARLIGDGMKPARSCALLRALMELHPEGTRDQRWNARYAEIDDIVASAARKFSKPDTADPEKNSEAAERAVGRRALARLVATMARKGCSADRIRAAAIAEGQRHGLGERDVEGAGEWFRRQLIAKKALRHG
jgi:hypothetical protein